MDHEKPVLLDRDKHRRRRVLPAHSFAFVQKVNSLYLAAAEFAEASRDYAIVFMRGPQQDIVPVAMLGLRARENLFVNGQAQWTGNYIPAIVRRYPFVLAQLPGQAMGVCIDEAYEGWSDDKGEPLFDAEGGNTPFLQNALDFLTRYQQEHQRTEEFCKRLEQAGLLTEMNAKADLTDGRSFTLSGVLVVDEKKLLALPDSVALSLFRSGELHLISLHLASLSNMKKLVDRMSERKMPLQPAPKPQ